MLWKTYPSLLASLNRLSQPSESSLKSLSVRNKKPAILSAKSLNTGLLSWNDKVDRPSSKYSDVDELRKMPSVGNILHAHPETSSRGV